MQLREDWQATGKKWERSIRSMSSDLLMIFVSQEVSLLSCTELSVLNLLGTLKVMDKSQES